MNKLQLQNINLEQLSNDELEYLQAQITQKKIKNLEDKYKKLEEMQKIQNDEFNLKVERMDDEIEKAKGMAEAHLRAKQVKYGWVNQGDFGRFFEQSIGSKTMGKLLKVVGLAQRNKSLTTPYRSFIPKYAMTSIQTGKGGYDFTKVEWHFENCIEFINNWLKANGYYEAFYSTRSSKEMEHFINNLFNKI